MSLYGRTLVLFWVCVCATLFGSVLVVFANPDRQLLATAAALGAFAMTAIVSVPIIRGYHYVGATDSLSHLGTTIDLNAGLRTMAESRYPDVHTLGSVLHDATGLDITHVLLLVVVIYTLAFFLFVPPSIRQLTGNTTMTYIGLFAGLLLLPINHLSPSMIIHPTSQALMYAPVVLFTFFSLYRTRTWRSSILFLLTAIVFILVHPQQAANLIAFTATIAVFQVGADLYRGVGLTRLTEWVLPEVTIFSVVFWLWVQNSEAFWDALEGRPSPLESVTSFSGAYPTQPLAGTPGSVVLSTIASSSAPLANRSSTTSRVLVYSPWRIETNGLLGGVVSTITLSESESVQLFAVSQ
jgi:hypothetical protein